MQFYSEATDEDWFEDEDLGFIRCAGKDYATNRKALGIDSGAIRARAENVPATVMAITNFTTLSATKHAPHQAASIVTES